MVRVNGGGRRPLTSGDALQLQYYLRRHRLRIVARRVRHAHRDLPRVSAAASKGAAPRGHLWLERISFGLEFGERRKLSSDWAVNAFSSGNCTLARAPLPAPIPRKLRRSRCRMPILRNGLPMSTAQYKSIQRHA